MRDGEIIVPGGQRYTAQPNFEVEPDASSASYFAAAAALVGGSVGLEGLRADSVQGDIAFMKLLERMGAAGRVARGRRESERQREKSHRRRCRDERDAGPRADARGDRSVLFVAHADSRRLFHSPSRKRPSARARHGASPDGRVGREYEDGILIEPSRIGAAAIETYEDHRIAMAFAVTGLKAARHSDQESRMRLEDLSGFFPRPRAVAERGS